SVTQRTDTPQFVCHFKSRQTESFAHAYDLMCRESPRAEPFFVAAAVNLCHQPHTWLAPHVKRPNPFGAIRFVRRHREKIDLPLGYMRYHARIAADLRQGRTILNDTDSTMHRHDRRHDSIGTQSGCKDIGAEQTAGRYGQVSDCETLAFKFPAGVQHRFMLR